MARPKNSTLTREKVVAGTIEMIGRDGLEAFSMPKLAASLGVRAPSLYHYFSGKDALFEEVARVVATPDPPVEMAADMQWTDYLVATAVRLRATMVEHPQCAPLLVRFLPRANMFNESEQMCMFLAASGVPSRFQVRIIDGLTALTIGAAFLNENSANYTDGGDGPTPDPDSYPVLRTALEAVGDDSPDQHFEKLLRTYLDGILREMAELEPASVPRRTPEASPPAPDRATGGRSGGPSRRRPQ